ncbi:unnamed protein product [Ectocarpus sp. CCAP 1310/34]|nr:unnamed protein product [Ectocarpus sp. CCAP 1310/34]
MSSSALCVKSNSYLRRAGHYHHQRNMSVVKVVPGKESDASGSGVEGDSEQDSPVGLQVGSGDVELALGHPSLKPSLESTSPAPDTIEEFKTQGGDSTVHRDARPTATMTPTRARAGPVVNFTPGRPPSFHFKQLFGQAESNDEKESSGVFPTLAARSTPPPRPVHSPPSVALAYTSPYSSRRGSRERRRIASQESLSAALQADERGAATPRSSAGYSTGKFTDLGMAPASTVASIAASFRSAPGGGAPLGTPTSSQQAAARFSPSSAAAMPPPAGEPSVVSAISAVLDAPGEQGNGGGDGGSGFQVVANGGVTRSAAARSSPLSTADPSSDQPRGVETAAAVTPAGGADQQQQQKEGTTTTMTPSAQQATAAKGQPLPPVTDVGIGEEERPQQQQKQQQQQQQQRVLSPVPPFDPTVDDAPSPSSPQARRSVSLKAASGVAGTHEGESDRAATVSATTTTAAAAAAQRAEGVEVVSVAMSDRGAGQRKRRGTFAKALSSSMSAGDFLGRFRTKKSSATPAVSRGVNGNATDAAASGNRRSSRPIFRDRASTKRRLSAPPRAAAAAAAAGASTKQAADVKHQQHQQHLQQPKEKEDGGAVSSKPTASAPPAGSVATFGDDSGGGVSVSVTTRAAAPGGAEETKSEEPAEPVADTPRAAPEEAVEEEAVELKEETRKDEVKEDEEDKTGEEKEEKKVEEEEGEEEPEAVVARTMSLKGMLECGRSLRMEGTFQGDLISTGRVVVAPTGKIKGDLKGLKFLLVEGQVVGDVVCDEVMVVNEGKVFGDISSARVTVGPQSTIRGRLTVVEDMDELAQLLLSEEGKQEEAPKEEEEPPKMEEESTAEDSSEVAASAAAGDAPEDTAVSGKDDGLVEGASRGVTTSDATGTAAGDADAAAGDDKEAEPEAETESDEGQEDQEYADKEDDLEDAAGVVAIATADAAGKAVEGGEVDTATAGVEEAMVVSVMEQHPKDGEGDACTLVTPEDSKEDFEDAMDDLAGLSFA